MKSSKKTLILKNILAFFIMSLLLYSVIIKISDMKDFEISLQKSPIIPFELVDVLKYTIPILELIIAMYFFFNEKIFFLIASFLFLIFGGYVYLMINHIHYAPCGCGGVIEQLSWQGHLLLNWGISLAAFACFLYLHKLNFSSKIYV